MAESRDVDATTGDPPNNPPGAISSSATRAVTADMRLAELDRWMRQHHTQLRHDTIEKAHAYGSQDLAIMGDTLARLKADVDLSESQKLQLAVAFYLSGKYARIIAALAEGRDPGADSWLDAEVYAMMGLRIRECGRWPGG